MNFGGVFSDKIGEDEAKCDAPIFSDGLVPTTNSFWLGMIHPMIRMMPKGPQKVAPFGRDRRDPGYFGKFRLVKYVFIWPDGVFEF